VQVFFYTGDRFCGDTGSMKYLKENAQLQRVMHSAALTVQ